MFFPGFTSPQYRPMGKKDSSSMCTSLDCSRRKSLTPRPSKYHRMFLPQRPRNPFRLSLLLKPKWMLFMVLSLCWNLRSSMVVSSHQGTNSNALPFFHQHHHRYQSSRPLLPSLAQQRTISNIRLRSGPAAAQLAGSSNTFDETLPLGGAGITLSDETVKEPIVIRSLPFRPSSSSALIPYDGGLQKRDPEFYSSEMEVPKRKKNCREPSVVTRGAQLMGQSMKRSYFAFSQAELDEKMREDELRNEKVRRKREIQDKQLSSAMSKRTETGSTATPEESPLPWTCLTKYEWKDMGEDHYPRFVRTAECQSRLCFNGFFRCRPRRYKTKVLKRVTPEDSASCEEDDVSLPDALRSNWKFKTVTINLCCDCTGRIPGNPEIG